MIRVNNYIGIIDVLYSAELEQLDNEYEGCCPCLYIEFELPNNKKIVLERSCWRIIEEDEKPIAHYVKDYANILTSEEITELTKMMLNKTKNGSWGYLYL